MDVDPLDVGVVHRRAVADDEQQARVDARHCDLRCPADEARPEDIGDLDGFTTHTTHIGRLAEIGRHCCRDRRQCVVGQDGVECCGVSHPLDQVRTRAVVDAAWVDHRYPQVVEAGLADGDQPLLTVPPAREDVAVLVDREVHRLALGVDDVVSDGRLAADREQVSGLERGAPARRRRRVDVGIDERQRVGLLAVDHGSRGIALQIGVGVGRVVTAGGEQARETENRGAEKIHLSSLSNCVGF